MNPRLRFKRDDGTDYPDWEEKKLGDICNINPQTEKLDDKFIYIDLSCIEQGEMLTKNIITKTKAPSRAKRVLSKNDVLFQSVRPHNLGHFHYKNIFDIQAVASTGFFQLRMINGLNSFLYQVLYTENFNKEVDVRCVGSNYPAINSSSFSEIVISLPCLEEQNKIADFLSDIDEVILASNQEVKKLQELKKGAMQKIFSQKVRFKRDDGTDYPNWEEKKLGDICNSFSGGTPRTGIDEYYNGNINFIRSGEIHDSKTELFISEEGLKNSSAKIVNVGDILLALYGATSGEIDLSKINGAINQAILCIRPQEGFNKKFIVEIFRYNKNNILKFYLQGGQGNLSAQNILKLNFPFPCLEEQQKIGDFLSDFDEAISLAKQELEKWKLLKKGLLQQMFV